VRTAISAGASGGRATLMFGDQKAQVSAIDARNGELLWKTKIEDHRMARLTGAPKRHGPRLYVPVSSHEEVSGGGANYECCTFRGSVVALDAASGKQVWKAYTIPDPAGPTRKN
jgi:polyvinyl alcohol dehydrogenase (cytochrome)